MVDEAPVGVQVPRRMIGTDAFQETPIVEVTRQITKHNYLVMDIRDLPRIIKEARPTPSCLHPCQFIAGERDDSTLEHYIPALRSGGCMCHRAGAALPARLLLLELNGSHELGLGCGLSMR